VNQRGKRGNVLGQKRQAKPLSAGFWAASLSSQPKAEKKEKTQLLCPLNWAVFVKVAGHLGSL